MVLTLNGGPLHVKNTLICHSIVELGSVHKSDNAIFAVSDFHNAMSCRRVQRVMCFTILGGNMSVLETMDAV